MIGNGLDRERGTSENRALYRQGFLRDVHQLVAVGYRRLEADKLHAHVEEDISALLAEAMQDAIDDGSEPWASRYCIHVERPIYNPAKTARKRSRVDVEVESTRHLPHPRFQFEAKRMYRTDSVAEYVGVEGMGSFLVRDYAQGHEDAGMLGYVQTGTVREWVQKVQKKLEDERSLHGMELTGDVWTEISDTDGLGLAPCYRSRHVRREQPFTVHHTFLVFCQGPASVPSSPGPASNGPAANTPGPQDQRAEVATPAVNSAPTTAGRA